MRSSTITKTAFGNCSHLHSNVIHCDGALGAFQSSHADFYTLPIPLILLDGLDSVIKLGPAAGQLSHTMGSVPPVTSSKLGDLDLLDTVSADAYSIALFFAMPVVTLFINYLYQKMALVYRGVSKSHCKLDNGPTVWNKLVRMLLNQPDYSPGGSTMKLVILLCLFATYFVTTVYLSMFGSDLTVTDGVTLLDTLAQFNESNMFVMYDEVSLTREIVFGSNDEISRVFQSKTFPDKPRWKMAEYKIGQRALANQEAIMLANLGYQLYFAGSYCLYQMVENAITSPINRYHVSKDTFMPTVTSYVYGHNITTELKRRLDSILEHYNEHGIDAHQSTIKPQIAFFAFSGSEAPWQCYQKKEVKEESFPVSASLRVLRKTLLISIGISAVSCVALILEKFTRLTGSWIQTRKRVVIKRQRMKRPPVVNQWMRRRSSIQVPRTIHTPSERRLLSYDPNQGVTQRRWALVPVDEIVTQPGASSQNHSVAHGHSIRPNPRIMRRSIIINYRKSNRRPSFLFQNI